MITGDGMKTLDAGEGHFEVTTIPARLGRLREHFVPSVRS